MIGPQIISCLVPEDWWIPSGAPERQTWRNAVTDALYAERRLSKGVNVNADRTSYNQACRYVESVVIDQLIKDGKARSCDLEELSTFSSDGSLCAVALEADSYLDFLSLLQDTVNDIRLGATIYRPDDVLTLVHRLGQFCREHGQSDRAAVKQRLALLKTAADNHCGVVEILSQWRCVEASTGRSGRWPAKDESIAACVIGIEDLDIAPGGELHESMTRILGAVLERALLSNGTAWNFSNTAHPVITEVLNNYVFCESKELVREAAVRVVYADGSEGMPFPLRCLPRNPSPGLGEDPEAIVIRAALISNRHLSLDREVDMAWFRNVEASQARTAAETDSTCHELAALSFASALEYVEQQGKTGLVIRLYHTGLPPAVVAFYRALVKAIPAWRAAGKVLRVLPMYFYGYGPYEEGSLWE